MQVAQHAAVEEHRILQTQFDAEFVRVAQGDLGDEHLNHDHRRPGVELVDDPLDFVEEARGGAQHQAVGYHFRHHHHFAFDLLEGAGCARRGQLLDLALAGQELIDRVGHVHRGRVLQPEDLVAAIPHAGVQPRQNRLDHDQVGRRSGDDDAVGPGVDGESQRHERSLAARAGDRRHRGGLPEGTAGARRRRSAKELLQRDGHVRRIAVDDGKDLQLGLGRRKLIELMDQRFDQFEVLRRRRDDQRVGLGVDRDADVREDPGVQQSSLFGVDGQQLQHGRPL